LSDCNDISGAVGFSRVTTAPSLLFRLRDELIQATHCGSSRECDGQDR